MKIETLKDLSKLIELCRKAGVDTIEVDGVKLSLGLEPKKEVRLPLSSEELPGASGKITTDIPASLTQEQLLLWSAVDPTGNQ